MFKPLLRSAMLTERGAAGGCIGASLDAGLRPAAAACGCGSQLTAICTRRSHRHLRNRNTFLRFEPLRLALGPDSVRVFVVATYDYRMTYGRVM